MSEEKSNVANGSPSDTQGIGYIFLAELFVNSVILKRE